MKQLFDLMKKLCDLMKALCDLMKQLCDLIKWLWDYHKTTHRGSRYPSPPQSNVRVIVFLHVGSPGSPGSPCFPQHLGEENHFYIIFKNNDVVDHNKNHTHAHALTHTHTHHTLKASRSSGGLNFPGARHDSATISAPGLTPNPT